MNCISWELLPWQRCISLQYLKAPKFVEDAFRGLRKRKVEVCGVQKPHIAVLKCDVRFLNRTSFRDIIQTYLRFHLNIFKKWLFIVCFDWYNRPNACMYVGSVPFLFLTGLNAYFLTANTFCSNHFIPRWYLALFKNIVIVYNQ